LTVSGLSKLGDVSASGPLSITGAVTMASTLEVAGYVNIASRILGRGEVIVERDSVVGQHARGLTIAADQGDTYTADLAVTDAMRHVSLVSNVAGASTIFNLRNIAANAGRGWDIIAEGGNSNRLIFQSQAALDSVAVPQPRACLSIDAYTGFLSVSGPAAFAGGISSAGDVAAFGQLTAGGGNVFVKQDDATKSAGLELQSRTGASRLSRIPGGDTELSFGAGSLTMHGETGKGVTIRGDNGDVVANGKLVIESTLQGAAYEEPCALTVRGGASIRGPAFLKGDLTVSGVVRGLQTVKDGTLALQAQDRINVTDITVHSCRVITVTDEILLTATFIVTPTADSSNTVFTLNLPGRTTPLATRLDLDSAQCSGFADDVNLVVLQNILCTGVAGQSKAVVQFQSVDTTAHYLQLFLAYKAM
jgi:hypothetical protein